MSQSHTELPWLPQAPDDFRQLCKALDASDPNVGNAVQQLATHRLSSAQARSLGKSIKRLQNADVALAPLSPLKLSILPGGTFDMVIETLPAAAARSGIELSVCAAPAEQVEQSAYNPQSDAIAFSPDVTLIAVDHRWLGLDRPSLDPAVSNAKIDSAYDRLRDIVRAISDSTGAPAIVCSLPTPPLPLFGNFDGRVAGTVRQMIVEFNARLHDFCTETGSILFEVAMIAEAIGTGQWFDYRMYHMYKLPFASEAIPLYCDKLGQLLGAFRGKARKCLVLDLDNTCWGGVIGDDGLASIKIGPGSAEGESFLAIQQLALDLKARGIILAVSSKNEDSNARQPFLEHPDMLLRENDIAVFQANWQDKPSNIEAIAETLNIGLDALVFLDDNAAERAQVRAALPVVAVPELPGDPSLFPALLASAGYFEALSFSQEDQQRVESYKAEAKRAEIRTKSRDLGDYLGSLEMQISFAPFSALGRPRIAQLVNKSNQFNLTTRRYSEKEIEQFENGRADFTLQVRLSDKFSDFGMIGVIIAHETDSKNAWEIDVWLMSCRVLGRRVEEAMLAQMVASAQENGVTTLIGCYIPTAKNAMVSEHYIKLGFDFAEEQADGTQLFRFNVPAFEAGDLPFSFAIADPEGILE
ncbi:MAG: HAD-IIIC family phosphatase [Sphingorhabdus sp.]